MSANNQMWFNVMITEQNKKDYEIVCFKKVKIDKYKVNDKEYEQVYIILDEDKHQIMRINGNMKNLVKNLVSVDNEEGEDNCLLYYLQNLEKIDFNNHSYYTYKLLTKSIKRDIFILNQCKSLTNYMNLFKQKPTIITINIKPEPVHEVDGLRVNKVDPECIEMINNKCNYKYIFNNLDELKDFNKKIYNFIQKHPSVNKIELYNLFEKTFEDEEGKEHKFIDFDIITKEIKL